jgi:hypothetical protein
LRCFLQPGKKTSRKETDIEVVKSREAWAQIHKIYYLIFSSHKNVLQMTAEPEKAVLLLMHNILLFIGLFYKYIYVYNLNF